MERMVARQAEAWVVDLTPYTLACWYIFVVAMPLTHVLGLMAHAPRRAMARHVLLYPLLGGRTHSIFSILAWVRVSRRSLCSARLLIVSPRCSQDGARCSSSECNFDQYPIYSVTRSGTATSWSTRHA